MSNQRIFSALQVLVRSLAHSVRGDLSVITNELSYLSSQISPDELTSASARCTAISKSLHALQFFRDRSLVVLAIDGVEMEALFQRHCELSRESCFSTARIDKELFDKVLVTLLAACMPDTNVRPRAVGRVIDAGLEVEICNPDVAAVELVWDSLLDGAHAALGEGVLPALALGDLLLSLMDIEVLVGLTRDRKHIHRILVKFAAALP